MHNKTFAFRTDGTEELASKLVGVRLVVPIAGLVVGIILFAVFGMAFSANKSDQTANNRNVNAIKSAVENIIQRMPQEQQSVFVGNEAYEKIVLSFDPRWTHTNIGRQLNAVHGHDMVAIISATGRPIYMMENGKKRAVSQFESYRQGVDGLVMGVQRLYRRHLINDRNGATTGAKIGAYGKVNQFVHKIHAFDAINLNGKVAFASVMAVSPTTGPKVVDLRSVATVISIKFLNAKVLSDIAASAVVQNLYVKPPSAAASAAAESGNYTIRNRNGRVSGILHWDAEQPGTDLVIQAMPMIALVIFTMIGLTIIILKTARDAAIAMQARESKARHDALHDPLTGLPNRNCFIRQVSTAIQNGKRDKSRIGCARMDLNDFKEINDTHGHLAGDRLIIEVGNRLGAVIGPDAFLARSGGDEYAILQLNVSDVSAMHAVCAEINKAMSKPFVIGDNRLVLSGNIGFAVAPDHAGSAEELVRRADMALHHAKKNKNIAIVRYSKSLEDRISERQALIHDLRYALAEEQLNLVYQPLIDADSLQTVGVEALLRWHHPKLGNIPPTVFIPLAEEFGLIDEIGRWVVATACRESRQWSDLPVAVNISPLHLCQPDFREQMEKITHAAGFENNRLTIEVTESALIEYGDKAGRILDSLRAVGMRIALDDFGTGYSSLSYLEQFSFDKIKIDRSFLRNLETSQRAAAIIHAIVGLADALNMTIVAEGVENEAQCRFLQATGCHQLQGFLFSKPVLAEQIGERLMVEKKKPDEYFFITGALANQDVA